MAAFALAALVLVPAVATADALDPAIAEIAAGDLASLEAGVLTLVRSKDPRALGILRAIRDRDARSRSEPPGLLVRVEGKWLDALARAPVADADVYEKVKVNNRVRRVLGPAIAQLSLREADRDVRLLAAQELAGSPAPALRASIAAARAEEQDSEVRAALEMALSRIDLGGDDDTRKLAAIAWAKAQGAIALEGDLARLSAAQAESAAVREAAEGALSSLQTKQLLVRIVGDLFYGISLGSVLTLAALGLAITFGLMGVINMAHGEMLMIGAYAAYVVQSLLAGSAAADYAVLVAIPVAFAVCTLVGVVLERTVLRHLYGRPLETLLATWGLSLALIQTVRLTFGAQNVAVQTPPWLAGGYEVLSGVVLPYNRVAIVLFTVVVVLALWLTLNQTPLGLKVRAVTQNRNMAAAMGIRTALVDMWTFGLGSGLAGLGGVALSQIGNVGPELGQSYIVDSFMVVVLGGVGKLAGTVLGALSIGVVNKLLEPMSGAVFAKILVLAFIILFIQRRPQGLFAVRGRVLEG